MLARDGRVLACGGNCCGQLGLGKVDRVGSMGVQVVQALAGKQILMVGCGSEHSVAVARGGVVWVWGRNIHGQLGNMVHQLHLDPPEYPKEYTPVEMIFRPEPPAGVEVQQVACGRDFTLVLFSNGQVWGCGHNFKYQLGIEHGQNAYYSTCVSDTWLSVRNPFSKSSAEDRRRLDATRECQVMDVDEYSRRVARGQARLLQQRAEDLPSDEDEDEEKGVQQGREENVVAKVTQIACGEEHTVAVLDNGVVVACGSGPVRLVPVSCFCHARSFLHVHPWLSFPRAHTRVLMCPRAGENGQLGIGHDLDMNFAVSIPAMSSRAECGVRVVCSSRGTFCYSPLPC